MKKTVYLVIAIMVLSLAVLIIPPKIQAYKAQFVSEFIETHFKEDIVFLAEVVPALCIEDHVLLKYMFDEAYLRDNYDLGNENKNKLIVAFLSEAEQGVKAAIPQNPFHEKLQTNLIAHYEKYQLDQITLENTEEKLEDLFVFATSLKTVLEESGAEKYFSEKFADVNDAKELIPSNQEKDGIFSKWAMSNIDSQTIDAAIKTIHTIANQNENYKSAYENGCMIDLMTGLKQMILNKKYR